MMVSFIDTHRAAYGIEPICRQLPIAPSMYYEHQARGVDPERLPARTKRDQLLSVAVRRVWDENQQVYGSKKAWKQLPPEQRGVAPFPAAPAATTSSGLTLILGFFSNTVSTV